MQVPGSGRGGSADDLGSRIVVYGVLVLVAAIVLGSAVALGLRDDHKKGPVATSHTQTETVAQPPSPPISDPPTTTEPDIAAGDTAPTTTEPDIAAGDTTPTTTEPDIVPGDATPTTDTPAPVDDCHDGIDNDGDDLVDAAQDDGCLADNTEAPANIPPSGTTTPKVTECNDGIDNDADGYVDREDPDCLGSAQSPSEGRG